MAVEHTLPVGAAAPEAVADTVLFLVSDESSLDTAHKLAPDVGTTEWGVLCLGILNDMIGTNWLPELKPRSP